jgi:predicted transcriptional regulator
MRNKMLNMSITIERPNKAIMSELNQMSQETGIDIEHIALDALIERLEDYDDIKEADKAHLARIENGEKTYTHEQVLKELELENEI